MLKISFRRKKNGVPILNKKEIEEIALSLLLDYDPSVLDKPASLDIDHFAECYAGLEMDYHDLTHNQSILGMMVFNDCKVPVYDAEKNKPKLIFAKEGTAIIDNSLLKEEQIRRGRFTVGHETSHWILHRQKFAINKNQMSLFENLEEEKPVIKCRTCDIENSAYLKRQTEKDDDDWLEWQADYLSSALLMPKRTFTGVVIEKFKNMGIRNGYYELGTDINLDLWAESLPYELADLFDVSYTAAKIRLRNLGLIQKAPENPRIKFQ